MVQNKQQLFHGLTTRCKGLLTGVTFHAKQAGTFWLDLWKSKPEETDTFILVFSKSISATSSGPTRIMFPTSVPVEERLTVGTHSSNNLPHCLSKTSGNKGFQTWKTLWLQEEGHFQVGVKELKSSDNIQSTPEYNIPSLQLHIQPDTVTANPSPGMV